MSNIDALINDSSFYPDSSICVHLGYRIYPFVLEFYLFNYVKVVLMYGDLITLFIVIFNLSEFFS